MEDVAVTLQDTVVDMIVAALPGAVLVRKHGDPFGPDDLVVFDGIIPATPPTRYAIVYIDDGTRRAAAACGQSDSATLRWQVQSVAPDRQMASWVATTILDATVDTKPDAAGWACGPVRHVFSERPGRDETVAERPVVYKPDLYELLATRT